MRKETTKKSSKIDVHMLTFTPMLAVIAFILMYIEMSVPIMPSFPQKSSVRAKLL